VEELSSAKHHSHKAPPETPDKIVIIILGASFSLFSYRKESKVVQQRTVSRSEAFGSKSRREEEEMRIVAI